MNELRVAVVGVGRMGLTHAENLASRVRRPVSILRSSVDAPSPNDRLAMAQAQEALREVIGVVNALFQEEVAEYREMLRQAGYTPFSVKEPLRVGRLP